MPEEQIIYLDPNDELTRVRERIEEVPARRIILVVPQQTQMRSNVGWRLLHARSREIGKEIQVISPDRQVRAVAKAAGFRVRDSQESSQSGKNRPSTRPSTHPAAHPPRGASERRGMQHPRGPAGRGPVGTRFSASTNPQREEQPDVGTRFSAPTPLQSAQSTWRPQESQGPGPQETITGQGQAKDYPPIEIIEDDEFDQPFEYRLDDTQAPTARPLGVHQDEEEQDPYIEDYRTSQRIRRAAQSGESKPPVDAQDPTSAFPAPRFSGPPEPMHTYPFDDVEEFSPSSLPEQHGATFAPGVDDVVPDVADVPTDVHEIEYLGDQGKFDDAQNIPSRQWPDAIIDGPDETAPPRIYGSRLRSSRSGKLTRRPDLDFGDADYLPPVEDQPTLTPAISPRPSGSMNVPRVGTRGAQPPARQQPPTRNPNIRPAPQTRPINGGGRPAAPPIPRQTSRPSRGRAGRVTTIVLVSLLLLLLIAIGLLYFETTATVTITLPSHSYSLPLPVKLEATTNSQDKLHNTVASQVLSYDASVSGSGLASGTAKVGSVSATGQVYITNHGTQLVTIPSKIVLTTTGGTGGVGFITTANAVALPGDFVPVMVQAQTPGTSGNVGPNTITVIPPESLAAIASFDGINSAQLNLSVTNPAALSGGGAQLVPAVTRGDLQALRVSLHQQLQTQFKAWLKQQVHPDDLRGTPAPDVLGNALPLAQEHLTGTPALNAPLSGKSFTGVLTAHITVLVVRAASIAAVAQARLNAAALAMRPAAYMLATQLPIKLAKSNLTPSKDGTSISFNLSASGQIIPLVNTQDVSMYISGKTKDQAISDIESGDAGTRGVENVTIQVSPSILSIMPFRTEHIYIVVVPDPGPTKALPKL